MPGRCFVVEEYVNLEHPQQPRPPAHISQQNARCRDYFRRHPRLVAVTLRFWELVWNEQQRNEPPLLSSSGNDEIQAANAANSAALPCLKQVPEGTLLEPTYRRLWESIFGSLTASLNKKQRPNSSANDSGGDVRLDFIQFHNALFELVDFWWTYDKKFGTTVDKSVLFKPTQDYSSSIPGFYAEMTVYDYSAYLLLVYDSITSNDRLLPPNQVKSLHAYAMQKEDGEIRGSGLTLGFSFFNNGDDSDMPGRKPTGTYAFHREKTPEPARVPTPEPIPDPTPKKPQPVSKPTPAPKKVIVAKRQQSMKQLPTYEKMDLTAVKSKLTRTQASENPLRDRILQERGMKAEGKVSRGMPASSMDDIYRTIAPTQANAVYHFNRSDVGSTETRVRSFERASSCKGKVQLKFVHAQQYAYVAGRETQVRSTRAVDFKEEREYLPYAMRTGTGQSNLMIALHGTTKQRLSALDGTVPQTSARESVHESLYVHTDRGSATVHTREGKRPTSAVSRKTRAPVIDSSNKPTADDAQDGFSIATEVSYDEQHTRQLSVASDLSSNVSFGTPLSSPREEGLTIGLGQQTSKKSFKLPRETLPRSPMRFVKSSPSRKRVHRSSFTNGAVLPDVLTVRPLTSTSVRPNQSIDRCSSTPLTLPHSTVDPATNNTIGEGEDTEFTFHRITYSAHGQSEHSHIARALRRAQTAKGRRPLLKKFKAKGFSRQIASAPVSPRR